MLSGGISKSQDFIFCFVFSISSTVHFHKAGYSVIYSLSFLSKPQNFLFSIELKKRSFESYTGFSFPFHYNEQGTGNCGHPHSIHFLYSTVLLFHCFSMKIYTRQTCLTVALTSYIFFSDSRMKQNALKLKEVRTRL